EIPEGLVWTSGDRNGHCVWLTYAREHGISLGRAVDQVYDTEYEAALRAALWYVVRTYPKETLQTFFYVKPQRIVTTALFMLKLRAPEGRHLPIVALGLQCAILIAFMLGWPLKGALADVAAAARLLSLFVVFSTIPQIMVWASPYTAIDFSVYVMI